MEGKQMRALHVLSNTVRICFKDTIVETGLVCSCVFNLRRVGHIRQHT